MWSLSRILSHTVLKQEAARRHQLWPMIGFTKTGEISQLWYSLLLTACQHNIVDHRRVSASLIVGGLHAAAIVCLILLLFLSETIWKCHEPGQFFPQPLTQSDTYAIRGGEPGIENFGFGKLFTGLWITKSGILIKLLSAKLYKVIQEWNLNLNMDCYQITFYIMTTFHVLRWAAHGGCLLPGARLLPAAEPMLINQWIKISLISLLYALWLHFTRKIGKNRIAQNIQSRLLQKLRGHKQWNIFRFKN